MDRYRLRDKRKRNKEIYEYYKVNPEITYDELGIQFNLTGSRAFAIVKRQKELELAKL